ncbi:MAG: DsbA family oxidoreductase [Burkholderiales bacterium]|nr:MAG: DsbA family oxidoreductase [Burkholderiales bacterium]
MRLQTEIVSDIVCPWCYIGKRRMESALQLFAKAHPEQPTPRVSWLPFQLNPDLPEAGMSRADYLQRKFGKPDGGGIYERVSAEGKKEGLNFNFHAITRQPNTLKAHALLAAALKADESAQQQATLKEALMQAYFCEGADLTQDATLLDIATRAGMPAEIANAVLSDTAAHEEAAAQDAELRRIGISGVPFFIINRKIGVSGAQPPEALLSAMEQALMSENSKET